MPQVSSLTNPLHQASSYHNLPAPDAMFILPNFLLELLGIEESVPRTHFTTTHEEEGAGRAGDIFWELCKQHQRSKGIYMPRPVYPFGHKIAFWEGHVLPTPAEAQQASGQIQKNHHPITDPHTMAGKEPFHAHVGYDYSYSPAVSSRISPAAPTNIPQAYCATAAPSVIDCYNSPKVVPSIQKRRAQIQTHVPPQYPVAHEARRRYYRYSAFMMAPSPDELPSL